MEKIPYLCKKTLEEIMEKLKHVIDKLFNSDYFRDVNGKKSGKRIVGIIGCFLMIPPVYIDSLHIFEVNEAILLGMTGIFAGLLGASMAEKPKEK